MRLRGDRDVDPTAIARELARVVHKHTDESINGVGGRADERRFITLLGIIEFDPVGQCDPLKALT